MSAVTDPPDTQAGPRPRLWTVDEFHRMADLGVFDRGLSRRHVMLLKGVIWEQHHGDPGDPSPRPFRFTRDHLVTLAAHHFLDGQRAHLIDGGVFVIPAMKEPHACGIVLVLDALRPVFGPGYYLRPQMPFDLGTHADPEPDVAVVSGSPRGGGPTPTAAVLIVEVADTSLAHDTTTKAEEYASAGIADYWVLDLGGQRLLVFRDPQPLPAGLGATAYRTHLTLSPADTVTPLAAPAAAIPVADLLP